MKEKEDIIQFLKEHTSESNLAGMARFGIITEKAFGISLPVLRALAKKYKNNHALALELWEAGYHETQLLAPMIDDFRQVTENQLEQWLKDFNSWDICDQCCSNLFDKTPFAVQKAVEWSGRPEEFQKRAGFVMMACLAVHAKKTADARFLDFLPLIVRESTDKRNFVRKAVNWALRQIGKRNMRLHPQALAVAEQLMTSEDATARWIGKDAYRELTNEKIIQRIKSKEK
ncbi:MAG TPA: DNA alkylation repair protein [Bacteroidales bacterium]|nr:DNA alkylation repair protein [Bacteroidales bacterium]